MGIVKINNKVYDTKTDQEIILEKCFERLGEIERYHNTRDIQLCASLDELEGLIFELDQKVDELDKKIERLNELITKKNKK